MPSGLREQPIVFEESGLIPTLVPTFAKGLCADDDHDDRKDEPGCLSGTVGAVVVLSANEGDDEYGRSPNGYEGPENDVFHGVLIGAGAEI
jgi:hypothetical protein